MSTLEIYILTQFSSADELKQIKKPFIVSVMCWDEDVGSRDELGCITLDWETEILRYNPEPIEIPMKHALIGFTNRFEKNLKSTYPSRKDPKVKIIAKGKISGTITLSTGFVSCVEGHGKIRFEDNHFLGLPPFDSKELDPQVPFSETRAYWFSQCCSMAYKPYTFANATAKQTWGKNLI